MKPIRAERIVLNRVLSENPFDATHRRDCCVVHPRDSAKAKIQ